MRVHQLRAAKPPPDRFSQKRVAKLQLRTAQGICKQVPTIKFAGNRVERVAHVFVVESR